MSFPNIYFSKFIFELTFLQNTTLPKFVGSMFRGAFGWAFRNAICVTKQDDCGNCILKSECIYYNAFETEIDNTNIYFLKGVKKLPHPFVIHQPLTTNRKFLKGDTLELPITILGHYSNFLPYLVYVFTKMGEKGVTKVNFKFNISNIFSIDYNLNKESIYSKNNDIKLQYPTIKLSDFLLDDYSKFTKAQITITSPLRLQKDGVVIGGSNNFSVNSFLNAVLRRYLAVSHLYCNQQDINNFSILDNNINIKIEKQNLTYTAVERFSNRQNTTMDMGGLTGLILLEGDFSKIGFLLKLGSFINIGKNTMFGNGGYNVNFY